jgi:hypothetical protein
LVHQSTLESNCQGYGGLEISVQLTVDWFQGNHDEILYAYESFLQGNSHDNTL